MKEAVKRTEYYLAQHLRMRRKEYAEKLTMAQLEQRLGTNKGCVGKIENNHRRIDLCEFIYYCQSLNLDPVKELRVIAAY